MERISIITILVLIMNTYHVNTHEMIFKCKLNSITDDGYRFPLGDSSGNGYYIAQKFQDKSMHNGEHLGIDVSGINKRNSDLGDTIFSINNGVVNFVAHDRYEYLSIYYKYKGEFIKGIYGHCDTIFCKDGDIVKKGQAIATVGNSDGIYDAHLHFEAIQDTNLWFGAYGTPEGFINPETILPHWSIKK